MKRYFEAFSSEQIRVYLYDDLRDKPIELLQEIFDFLKVDNKFTPDLSTKYNISQLKRVPRNTRLHNFLTKDNYIKSVLKIFFPIKLRQTITGYLNKKNITQAKEPFKPSFSAQLRTQLIEEYKEDIFNLQALINHDLSRWLE
ncbi:MAG: hypothetical protein F6K54_12795 [Okeania sp. SIO3B5]|uniref:hypothetical protein n=1 Tax=Okeania sp. SIO3B5 TaxID=2607811 RepID=UPI0013FF2365|nr:hypothetical protein [Okeania sp. SIO3B5]NEO53880.1 hypothetical protein [Okeania sp. SIO3B5]